jgi:L-alanine-DL-glutamate epimerase-like enolase superfamily enzyme
MIELDAAALRLPFRLTVKHASASRARGASLWVTARRGGHTGLGEGCPRDYVTGETPQSCQGFLRRWLPQVAQGVLDVQRLRAFVEAQRRELDRNPAAWCAVECALLDLFARQAGQSVEALLGQPEPGGVYTYSAVVNSGQVEASVAQIKRYAAHGMFDFKVKLSGDLEADRARLAAIAALPGQGVPRVRLDANNLWAGDPRAARAYLEALGCAGLAGLEEPLAPRDVEGLSHLSQVLDLPIILDESCCTVEDLALFAQAPGRWIANLKVSKVGGPLRALELVEALRTLGWPVILGAHVGETSVLVRAAQLVARAVGPGLMAQEGAFGDLVLERDMTAPSLKFGPKGELSTLTPLEGWGLTPIHDPGDFD